MSQQKNDNKNNFKPISISDKIALYTLTQAKIVRQMEQRPRVASRICMTLLHYLALSDRHFITLEQLPLYFPELYAYAPKSNPQPNQLWFIDIPYFDRDTHRINILNEIIVKLENDLKNGKK